MALASWMRQSSSAARMRVEETTCPWYCAISTTWVSMPWAAHSACSSATLPAAFAPKVKLSPQNTALAAKQPTSTFRTKSSGERAQKSAKGASWYSVMPSSATRRCFSRSGKMRPPLRGWSAGSEKVNAAAVSPWAAA